MLRFSSRTLATLGALCIASASVAAPGDTLRASNPQSVVAALQDAGFRAEFAPSNSSGRPRIQSSVDGTNFSIWFYGCNDDMKECDIMLLTAGFDLRDGTTLEVANKWNSEDVMTRSYLDDEMDPFLEMPIVNAKEISREEFADIMRRWGNAVADFTDEIGFNK